MDGNTSWALADDRHVNQSANALDNTHPNDTFRGTFEEYVMRSLAFAFALFATPLSAHEFWLEPREYQVASGGEIVGDLVNGQDFEGPNLAYLPQRFKHFAIFHDSGSFNVPGRVGDTPALTMDALGDGLHVFAYQSVPSVISYEEWEKFQAFVDHKDLGDVLSLHEARGLPLEGFNEMYIRYSKSLVGVGNGAGADRRVGFETEIVALTNPYVDDVSDGMRFQLFYRTEVRPNARFEIYEKAPDGTVTQTFYVTNAEGIATIPVKSGHSYMADAVALREPTAQKAGDTGAVWETLWANMTWAVP